MHAVLKGNVPAYDGARFDAGGFCLAHSDVLLCQPTDGKYRTVRKTCFKCGNANNLASRRQRKKLNRHRRRTMPVRDATNEKDESATAGNVVGRGGKGKDRRASQDGSARARAAVERVVSRHVPNNKKAERRDNRDESTWARARAERRAARCRDAPAPARRCKTLVRGYDDRRSRGRTLSPLRKGLPPKSPNGPSSYSSAKKKVVTDEKIRELIRLMPPLCTKRDAGADASKRFNHTNAAKGNRHHAPGQTVVMPFDENGHCRAHPEVRLAERGAREGEWKVVSGVCPQCCVSAVLACQQQQPATAGARTLGKKSNAKEGPADGYDEMIGKVLLMSGCKQQHSAATGIQTLDEKLSANEGPTEGPDNILGKAPAPGDGSNRTQPTSASSSYPTTPESASRPAFSSDYFAHANRGIVGLALNIREGERMAAPLVGPGASVGAIERQNAAGASETTGEARGPRPSMSKEPPGRRL